MKTGSSADGRLLAQTAVTLDRPGSRWPRKDGWEHAIQMMSFGKTVAAVAVASAVSVGLSGCQKENPAERAGRQVDKAVEKAGQEIDRAGRKTGQVLEKTGEKIRDTAKSATNSAPATSQRARLMRKSTKANRSQPSRDYMSHRFFISR